MSGLGAPHQGESMNTLYDHVVDVVGTRFDDGCWVWHGQHVSGYTRVKYRGKNKRVHRVAYELRYGLVPDGLELDHTCNNKTCWNPDHVEPVTHQENCIRTSHSHSLKTHCSKGHPYNFGNTYQTKGSPSHTSQRQCRTCNRERKLRAYHLEGRAIHA